MIDRLAEFFIFGFTPLVVGMLATPEVSRAAERTLSGEVIYRERMALPPEAVLTVQLVDVSRADAPGAVLGERRFEPAGQVPVRFEIGFDPAALRPQGTYALRASITVGDRLLFVSDRLHRVDPLGDAPQIVLVRPARSGD